MYSADVRRIAQRLYSNYLSLRKVAVIIGSSHSSIMTYVVMAELCSKTS